MLTEEEKKKIAKQNEAWAKSHKAGGTVSDTQLLSGLNTSGKSSSSGSKSSSGGGSSAGSKYASTSKPLSDEEIAAKWERKYGQSYDKRDTKDGKHDFVDRIANRTSNLRKEWQTRRNEQESSDIFETRRLQQRDDFDELAEHGAALADQRFGLGNKVQRAINQSEAQADFLRRSGVPEEYIGKGYVQNIYDYMTPLQRSTYNAFIGMGNRQGAKAYLRSIEAELNQQAANAILPNRENDGFVDTLAMAIDAGASSYINNERQRGKSDSIAPSYQEIVHDEVRPTLTGAQGLAADVGYTIGQQILPVAGSMLFSYGMEAKTALKTVRALTSAAMGANAGAGAYREAVRDSSTDKFDAHVYGLINGALEGGLQYAIGGITAAGSGGIVKALGKTGIDKAVAKKLANVSKAAATTPAVKNLIRAMVASGKYIGGSADEAIEEWLQAVIDVPIRNYIFDENNEIQPFSEDKLYAGLLGALTAGVMNAANVPSDFVNADQTLQNAVIEHERKKNGRKGSTTPVEPLELTPEQQAQVEGDTKLKDLASHVAQLQAQLANTKNKKQRETLQAKLDKYTKQLEERLNAAPQAVGSTQSTNNAQPVEPTEETQPVESGQLISNEVGNVPQEEAVPPSLSGIDMIRRGLERGRGEQGRGLIGAGLQNGNGIISPQTDLTRPTGERLNNQQQRGVMPGDTRRQNILNREEQRPEALPFEEPGGRGRVGAREGNSAEMVNWYRTGVSQSVAEYASGTMPLRGAQTGIRTQVDNFRNYARDVLGWPEDRIEAEVASWNIPAELMQEPQLPPRTGFRMEKQQPSAQQQAPAAQQQAATPDVQQEAAAVAETRQELQESKAELAELKAQLEELKSQLVESGQVTDEDIDNILNEPEQEQPTVDNGPVTDEDIQQAVESAPKYTPEQVIRAYRKAAAEAEEYYKMGATKAQYAQDIRNAKNNFLYYAAEAGMSQEEIQAELDRGPQVNDRDIGSTTRMEDLDAPPAKLQDEETSATKSTKEIRRVVEAIENDALTTDEAVDRLAEIANQDESRDLPPIDEDDIPEEREEAPPEDELAALTAERKAQEKHYYDAEVNVTAGEISVEFAHNPGKTATGKLRAAGLTYDGKTRTWWGTPTRKALETVQELTGQKLIEDEFKPQTKRITKEGLANGEQQQQEGQSLLRETPQRKGSNIQFHSVQGFYREDADETREELSKEHLRRWQVVQGLPGVEIIDFLDVINREGAAYNGIQDINAAGGAEVFTLSDDAVDELRRDGDPLAEDIDFATSIFRDEIEANNMSPDDAPNLRFYIPMDTDRTENLFAYCDGFYDEESNTMWLDASNHIGANLPHEFLHHRLTETGLYDKVLSTLHDFGFDDTLIGEIIDKYIAPTWFNCYGKPRDQLGNPRPEAIRLYTQELMCELYSGNDETFRAIGRIVVDIGDPRLTDLVALQWAVRDAVRSTPVHRQSDFEARYLELAQNPEQNKAELEQMVRQAAKDQGLDLELYHGTPDFGWTVTDVQKSDDHLTFFATDDLDIARTYSAGRGTRGAGPGVRSISPQLRAKETQQEKEKLEQAQTKLKYQLDQAQEDVDNLSDKLASEFLEWMTDNGFSALAGSMRTKDQYAKAFVGEIIKHYDDLESDVDGDLTDSFVGGWIATSFDDDHPLQREWFIDNGGVLEDDELGMLDYDEVKPEFRDAWVEWHNDRLDWINSFDREAFTSELYDIMNKAKEVTDRRWDIENRIEQISWQIKTIKQGGAYRFFASSEDLFQIDAKGGLWWNIPGSALAIDGSLDEAVSWFVATNPLYKKSFWQMSESEKKKATQRLKKAHFKTREVAKFARYAGYRGVKIEGLVDTNDQNVKKPAKVCIFLDPQNQVKSADPVTYDNSGNVIPIGKRFNRANRDLRRSMRRTGTAQTNSENTPNIGGVRFSAKKKPNATRSTFTPDENGERPVDRWPQEMQDAVNGLPDDIRRYIRKHQADTNGEAWRAIVKRGGVDKVSGTLLKASRWNPQQLEMATEISKYFAEHGETDRASEMVSKLLNQQTEFGRAIQFLQTLQKYMPHAVASVSHSIANELDVELTDEEKADIGLCDSIIENGYISDSMIKQASPEFAEWLEEARPHLNNGQLEPETAAYAAAMRIVVRKAPAPKRDKFRALQRISLLSNPKTHIRNILGNAAEQTGTIMARPAAALADRALGKMFGNGQRTFGSGGGQAFLESTVDAVERAKMDYDLGINTVGNKFDESTKSNMKSLAQRGAFDEEGHGALRNGIGKVLNKIDSVIGLGLSAGDAPFLLGTYDSVLTQLMDAQGVDEATPEMIETALDVAYRRTFRDDNAVTKALSSVRESLPFIGETVAPYVQTPVNVVLTAVQYSPIGFAEAVIKTFFGENSLRNLSNKGESTMKVQRQVADLIGRGAVGSAFMLIGILMAAAGKITPDDDDIESTKEKNWNTATGRRGSSIKFGDRYVDPSSLQSLSTPLMAGAAAYDRDEEGNLDWAGILGAAVKASMKMGNTMLEMPVLQGVADLFSGNYDNGELLAGMLGLASDAATQAIPFASLGRQVAKTFDPYSRVQSEINEGPFKRIVKNGFNDVRAMTPGVRQTLPERRDVLGNPIKNDASKGFIGRAYNSLLNPFNTSRANSNEVTDEIDRLFAELQDTDVLPTAAGNSLSYGGEKYKFSSAEKQEFQRIEGESNMELLTSLVNSSAYDSLSDEEKMDVIKSVYDYSSDKAKRAYLEKQGIELEEEDNLLKWPATIDSLVETGIDIGSALIYRKQISAISDKDEQVYYINSLDLNADQKGALDEAFISRWTSHYNDKTRDYTNEDTLNLSMTSDSSQRKYEARFKNGWYGSSGTHYPGIDSKMYKDLCDAYWFKDSPKAEESRQSIKRMLMEAPYYMDEDEADQFSYDFRKRYGSTKD